MSSHVEWADASYLGVTVCQPGEFEDAYGSKNDKAALVFSNDDAFVVEGTKHELLTMLRIATANVERWL